MTDKLTSEQRHLCMSHIRSKNTKPEMIVRKYLFAQGYRYRLHVKRLPGTPDIVLKKYRTIIFVNGCFWHGHEGCKYAKLPARNIAFWQNKITENKQRDLKDRIELRDLGWHVVTIWQCQLKAKNKEITLESLDYTLNSFYLSELKINNYVSVSEEDDHTALMAAEDKVETTT